jgi:protein-S-isoprenylcysteine O-methyltransferase Ste14
MLKIIKAANGMNIAGQGPKVMLFTLPFAILAVILHWYGGHAAMLPFSLAFAQTIGIIFLILGGVQWLTAIAQLLHGFPKGKLVTTGAYGICRNPIYSSFIVFILPAISLLTWTWVYLAVALVMWVGVVIFIRKEEEDLYRIFGIEYAQYKARVGRIIPFFKPQNAPNAK